MSGVRKMCVNLSDSIHWDLVGCLQHLFSLRFSVHWFGLFCLCLTKKESYESMKYEELHNSELILVSKMVSWPNLLHRGTEIQRVGWGSRQYNELGNKTDAVWVCVCNLCVCVIVSQSIVLDDVYKPDWRRSRSFLISDLDICEHCDCSESISCPEWPLQSRTMTLHST